MGNEVTVLNPDGKINYGRVILGGLVAGVIINIIESVMNGVILAKQWNDAMVAVGQHPVSTKQVIAYMVWGFAIGILTIWLYAAIRPRYGAGPKTAMCAGLYMWGVGFALAMFAPVIMHIFPVGLVMTTLAVEIVEMLVAAVAGAYFYKESSAAGGKSSAAGA